MDNQDILSKIRDYYEMGRWKIIIPIREHNYEVAKQLVKEAIPEIQEDELNSFIEWYTQELSKQYDTPENIAAINAYEAKKACQKSVTCPYCKSTNTSKISVASKAAHTAVFGIFSVGRNAKQWHCNNCKSDF